MMDEKEILKEIHDGFETSGQYLSDDFLNNEDFFKSEINVTDSVKKKNSYLTIIAACAAAVSVIAAGTVTIFTDAKRMKGTEQPGSGALAEYTVTVQTSETASPESFAEETGMAADTSEITTDYSNAGSSVFTDVPDESLTCENTIISAAPVTPKPVTVPVLITSSETHRTNDVTAEQSDYTPETSQVPEKLPPPETEPPAETEQLIQTSSEIVESPDNEQENFRILLVLNPDSREECIPVEGESTDMMVFTDSEYIYTFADPDMYLVTIFYPSETVTVSVSDAVNNHHIEISRLVDAGLSYTSKIRISGD